MIIIIPYLITFFLSFVFLSLAGREKTKHKKVLVFIGLLIPCLLAGFRAKNIGTDVRIYLNPLFENALNSNSFGEYLNSTFAGTWSVKLVSSFEFGFSLLVFLTAKLFHNIHAAMLLIEILIIVPFYKALKKLFDDKYISFGMLLYYLLFFNIGLNAMRQFIAISLSFLAFACAIKKENKQSIAYFVISFLFHKSSIIMFLITIGYWIVNFKDIVFKIHSRQISLKRIIALLIIALSIFLVFNISIVRYFLEFINLDEYSKYLGGETYLLKSKIISKLPLILFVLWNLRKYVKVNRLNLFWISLFVIEILVEQLSSINIYTIRVSYYFSILNIYLFLDIIRNLKKHQKLSFSYLTIYSIIYWTYYFAICGAHETIPYVFL